jgi:para-aminobenzoate synthetase
VYSGCLGFLSVTGPVDLNVVIRTLIHTPSGLTCGTGGAITILSDPKEELDEINLKLKALLKSSWMASVLSSA